MEHNAQPSPDFRYLQKPTFFSFLTKMLPRRLTFDEDDDASMSSTGPFSPLLPSMYRAMTDESSYSEDSEDSADSADSAYSADSADSFPSSTPSSLEMTDMDSDTNTIQTNSGYNVPAFLHFTSPSSVMSTLSNSSPSTLMMSLHEITETSDEQPPVPTTVTPSETPGTRTPTVTPSETLGTRTPTVTPNETPGMRIKDNSANHNNDPLTATLVGAIRKRSGNSRRRQSSLSKCIDHASMAYKASCALCARISSDPNAQCPHVTPAMSIGPFLGGASGSGDGSAGASPKNISQEIEELRRNVDKGRKDQFRFDYNFDLADEKPLPGKYQWTRLE